jgi:dTDP-4-dehydrorhamnose reductase
MSILVTGAGGQLGQDMVKACEQRYIPCIPAGSGTLDITCFQDITDFVDQRPKITAIINCAAYNAVDDAEQHWKKAFLVNGIGVRNLTIAANSHRVPLVHFSSDYVFDGRQDIAYTIGDRPNPVSMYGKSKLLGEQFVRDLAERYYLIRVSWVFGRGNTNFAKKILEWSGEKRQLRVVDDQVASPTYTVDLAGATLDLLNSGRFGLYHITNSGYCSRYAWAAFILEKTGWSGELRPAKSGDFPTNARRPPFSVLDNFGTEETLGYSLPSWQDATNRFLKELEAIP